MKKFMLMGMVLFSFVSCTILRPNESWENLLNKSPKPITVISISSNKNPYPSILFRDSREHLFTIKGEQFYSLKVGDTFY